MGARVVDGIAGATNVEEGDPLVPGGDQLGLSGLQVIGVCYFDIRRHDVLLGESVGSMPLVCQSASSRPSPHPPADHDAVRGMVHSGLKRRQRALRTLPFR